MRANVDLLARARRRSRQAEGDECSWPNDALALTASTPRANCVVSGFNGLWGVTSLGPGRLLVVENGTRRLYALSGQRYQNKEVIAGTGVQGTADGAAVTSAQLYSPMFAACGADDTVYYTDGHSIRSLSPKTGLVTTVAGVATSSGSTNGSGTAARFINPYGLVVDDIEGLLYVAEHGASLIRTVCIVDGTASTLTELMVQRPIGVALCKDQDVLYVSSYSCHQIMRIHLATGQVTAWAGSGSAGLQDGASRAARFNCPWGIALDGEGNLYVADSGNGCVRKVDTVGEVSTLIPTGVLSRPYDICITPTGELVVADSGQGCIHVFELGLQPVGSIRVPPSSYKMRMASLLESGIHADVTFLVRYQQHAFPPYHATQLYARHGCLLHLFAMCPCSVTVADTLCDCVPETRVICLQSLCMLQVGKEEIKAHRCILVAQCEYFGKMLLTDQFTEGQSGVVQVSAQAAGHTATATMSVRNCIQLMEVACSV